MFQRVDVSNSAEVNAAVDALAAKWGRIDVLVNNAGIVTDGQLVKWKDGALTGMMSDEVFDKVIDVNLKGPFLCARAVVPHMIRAGGGAVLNASSVVGLYGNFGQTNYVATKAGVIGMTRTWARELAKLQDPRQRGGPRLHRHGDPQGHAAEGAGGYDCQDPLGRMGEPSDIANAYVWLASDLAAVHHRHRDFGGRGNRHRDDG